MIARIGAVTMFVAAAFVAAAPASAVVLIDDTPSFVQPDENVLLKDDDIAALAIQGVTNQTATIVDFTQPNNAEQILSPSMGQSRIDSVDGEFTSLRIQLAGGLQMSELEADVHFIDDGLSFTVKAFDLGGIELASETFTTANGQNFFGVKIVGLGSLIGYVDILAGLNEIEDVRQVRVSQATPVVPEPGTLALMAMGGLGLVGGWARKRKVAV